MVGFHCSDRTLVRRAGARSAVRAPDARRTGASSAYELLAEFGMEEYAQCLAGELSYGHQRRVEIMRALALEPQCAAARRAGGRHERRRGARARRDLSPFAERGLAVLVIEHNMQLVMTLCDELYVLESGELIAHGRRSRCATIRAWSKPISESRLC